MDLAVVGNKIRSPTKCGNRVCSIKDQCGRMALSVELKEAMYFEALGDNPCRYFIPKEEMEDR